MPINLNNTVQSEIYFEGLKGKMYHEVGKTDNFTIRTVGLWTGAMSGFLEVIKRVAGVFESFIKGLVNIVGSPFSNRCDLLKGVKQITIGLACNIVLLACSPMYALAHTVLDVVGYLALANTYGTLVTEHHMTNTLELKEIAKGNDVVYPIRATLFA